MTNPFKFLSIRYWVAWNADGTNSVTAARTMPPRVGPYHAKRRGSATPEEAQSLVDGMDRAALRFYKRKAKQQSEAR